MSCIASPASALCLYEPEQAHVKQSGRSSQAIAIHERMSTQREEGRHDRRSHGMPRGIRDSVQMEDMRQDYMKMVCSPEHMMKNRVDPSRTRMPVKTRQTTDMSVERMSC
jgi:hypothetical protein